MRRVLVKKRVYVEEYWVCPNCEEEIGEKDSYSKNDGRSFIHNKCGGEYVLPPPKLIVNPNELGETLNRMVFDRWIGEELSRIDEQLKKMPCPVDRVTKRLARKRKRSGVNMRRRLKNSIEVDDVKR